MDFLNCTMFASDFLLEVSDYEDEAFNIKTDGFLYENKFQDFMKCVKQVDFMKVHFLDFIKQT